MFDFADGLSPRSIQTLAGAIARKILDERMWQCKTRRGRKLNDLRPAKTGSGRLRRGAPRTPKNPRRGGRRPRKPRTKNKKKKKILFCKPKQGWWGTTP